MAATPYTTLPKLTTAVGADVLAALAPDSAAADGINLTAVTAAIEAANSRVDGKVQILHEIPVAAEKIPDWLSLAATRIAHYELCADEAAITDIIRERYKDAIMQINDVGLGRTKLFISTTDDEPMGVVRTVANKAHFADTGERRFRRKDTSGIV